MIGGPVKLDGRTVVAADDIVEAAAHFAIVLASISYLYLYLYYERWIGGASESVSRTAEDGKTTSKGGWSVRPLHATIPTTPKHRRPSMRASGVKLRVV